jgi:retinol-binding protein 3
MKNAVYIILLWMLSISSCNATSTFNADVITEEEKAEVINSIRDLLIRNYVFPEKGTEMAKFLKEKLEGGKYKNITSPTAFGEELTNDLQSISHDKHLRVRFEPNKIQTIREAEQNRDPAALRKLEMENMEKSNYGFKEVKVLEGNIGYINLTNFFDTEFAAEAAYSALEKVKDTDAIIIDLRENGGGSPTMIQLISSYFFEKSVHLNTFYFRPANNYSETWTYNSISGKKMSDAKLYLLTSKYTFSAAEEFSYNLKNLKRATLIGETTGGGAHPGGTRIINSRYTMFLPTGRAINPITNTNWEGTGVEPDIKTAAKDALDKALEIIRGGSIN